MNYTDNMKICKEQQLKIKDIVNTLDRDDLILYMGRDVNFEDKAEKNVLLISHDLTLTGAPTVLLQMAETLMKKGYTVFVLCHQDGILRDKMIDNGISVLIREKYLADKYWCMELCKIFDFFVVNTLAIYEMFLWLNLKKVKTIWWIHEQEDNFKLIERYTDLNNIKLSDNSRILSAGPYVQKMIKKYMNIDSDILNFGVEDVKCADKELQNKEFVEFVNVGLINENKRQDILVDAINKLDESIKNKARFTFCGDFSRADIAIAKKILDLVSQNKNVRLVDQMPHIELMEMLDSMDSVIVTSKEETTSAIMVEGFMKEKIGICSETCGITHYLHNGIDAFIYPYGDSDKLAEIITYVVNNYDKLDKVKAAGRNIYEQIYSPQIFLQEIDKIIHSMK